MTKRWTNWGSIGAALTVVWLTAPLAVLSGASPVLAQSPPPGYVPPPNGPYAAAPVVDFVDPLWVPPRAVMRMLRSAGYEILSRPRVRGVLYSMAVVTPDGEDGRIFMDARDGRLVRFVPGFALSNRTEDDVEFAYNPPAPPLNPPAPPLGASPRKPPPSAPKVASRPPATTGIAPSSTKQAAPKPGETRPAQSPAQSAPVTAAAPPPQTQAIATKPAELKPPVVIQPTQEMPSVLGLE